MMTCPSTHDETKPLKVLHPSLSLLGLSSGFLPPLDDANLGWMLSTSDNRLYRSAGREMFIGSSQSWSFQTWLFAIFTRKGSFALFVPFCALLCSCVCALLRSFACFCVQPRVERPRLGISEFRKGLVCFHTRNHENHGNHEMRFLKTSRFSIL